MPRFKGFDEITSVQGRQEWDALQKEIAAWNERWFPGDPSYLKLLGVAEEVGELCHAHLKGEQGIRHRPDEILRKKMDAVGDILVFLHGYCELENISLRDCFWMAWEETKDRNWEEDPKLQGNPGNQEENNDDRPEQTTPAAGGRRDQVEEMQRDAGPADHQPERLGEGVRDADGTEVEPESGPSPDPSADQEAR